MSKRRFKVIFDCRVVEFFDEEISMINKKILVK